MKKLFAWLSIFFLFMFSFESPISACTDFRIIAQDNTVLITRSMEFSMDLNSNLRSSTRNRAFVTTTPNGKSGMAWKAKYGYLFVDGLNQDFTVDGMNENGLSFEYLYLPGETAYQTIPVGKESQAIPYYYLGDWVLGNFKTVDEVRLALANVYIYAQTLPVAGNIIFPLHAAIFDPTGKGIVVEFVRGKINIYDHMGVMTNSPTYNWHVTDLRNYLNLSPYNPNPIVENGITYAVTGQGAGMLGLPGDISPPSRFTKTAFLLKTAYPVKSAAEALNLGQHIINNVDIPNGLARAVMNGKETSETTQWVVFKDLTHKLFYYRTYNDMTIRKVAMDKVDFSPAAIRLKMPLVNEPYIEERTSDFINAKTN